MNILCEAINAYTTKEEYTLAICLVNFTLRHGHFLTTVKLIKHYFQYFWSLLINMEHNLYNKDTDDYYDDDSDTLIMDLSDICDKSYDSEEENETLLE